MVLCDLPVFFLVKIFFYRIDLHKFHLVMSACLLCSHMSMDIFYAKSLHTNAKLMQRT